MSVQALTLLPSEMWTNIGQFLPLLPNKLVALKLCSTSTMRSDVFTTVLPNLVIPLMRYLSNSDVLFSLRHVNRNLKKYIDHLVQTALKENHEWRIPILPKRLIATLKLSVFEFPTFCRDMKFYLNNNKTAILGSLHLCMTVTEDYPIDESVIFNYLKKYEINVFRLKLHVKSESFVSLRQVFWKYLSCFSNMRRVELISELIPSSNTPIYLERFRPDREVNVPSPITIFVSPLLKTISISTYYWEYQKKHRCECDDYFAKLFNSLEQIESLSFAPLFFRNYLRLIDDSLPNLVEFDLVIGENLNFKELSHFLRGRFIKKLTIRWTPSEHSDIVEFWNNTDDANFKMWANIHELQETLTYLHLYFEYEFFHDVLPTSRITVLIKLPKLKTLTITNGMIVDFDVLMKAKSLEKIDIMLTDDVWYGTPVVIPTNDDVDKIWTIVPSLRVFTIEDKRANKRYFWSREIFEFNNNK